WHQLRLLFRPRRETSATELPVDLASGRVDRRLEQGDVFRLLAQHDLADDGLNVVVGQLYGKREPVDELLQCGRGREGALAGGDEEHGALEPRRATLHDVLHHQRLVVVVAYVLLHLVEYNERQRQLARRRGLETEDVVHDVEHLVVADVLRG